MHRTWLIGFVVAGLFVGVLIGVACAATGYSLTCLNKDCGYKGECKMGPTKLMDSVDGYCAACDKWVNLRWKRDGEKAPAPLGKVWVPATGKTLEVYACPTCKGPFLPVTAADQCDGSKYAPKVAGEQDPMMRCPKCGEPSLRMHVRMFLD
jgi:hypothetical protein